MKKFRQAAGALLLLSCITHFAEALILTPDHAMGSMIFGLIYFCVGILLLAKKPKAYHAALFFTLLGAIAACVLLIQGHFNLFLLLHLAIDVFVIYVCIKYFKKMKAKASTSP